ncbi:MAG: hypothetical protein RL760_397 [Candidatus Eisenbacteria bacterium]
MRRAVAVRERARLLLELFRKWEQAPPPFQCGYCCTGNAMLETVRLLYGITTDLGRVRVSTCNRNEVGPEIAMFLDRVGIEGLRRPSDRLLLGETLEAVTSEDLATLDPTSTVKALRFCLGVAGLTLTRQPGLTAALTGVVEQNPMDKAAIASFLSSAG